MLVNTVYLCYVALCIIINYQSYDYDSKTMSKTMIDCVNSDYAPIDFIHTE